MCKQILKALKATFEVCPKTGSSYFIVCMHATTVFVYACLSELQSVYLMSGDIPVRVPGGIYLLGMV